MTNQPANLPVALVTGASAGIGAFTAAALARAGYRVFGTSRQPEAGGGREVEMLALDVQSDASVAACLQQVLGAAGRLDLLVNNAGLGHNSLIEETSLEQARFVLETNFWGAVRVTTAALPAMRQQRAGRVIVLGSVAGLIGAVGMAYYSASKFALEGWSEALSYEVEPFGVRVSVVEPGYFKTHAGASLLTAAHTISEYDGIRREVLAAMQRARDRGGDARRVAAAIVRIAQSPNPRLHYRVGLDAAWFPRFHSWVPERIFRYFVKKNYRLP
jgi:NAD(P)-dependent dehydrogenase (short-subunit alcohol dehydrogenase family)